MAKEHDSPDKDVMKAYLNQVTSILFNCKGVAEYYKDSKQDTIEAGLAARTTDQMRFYLQLDHHKTLFLREWKREEQTVMFYAATIHRRMAIDEMLNDDMVVHRGLIVGASRFEEHFIKNEGGKDLKIYQQDDDKNQQQNVDECLKDLIGPAGMVILEDRNHLSTSPLLEICLRNNKNEQKEFDKLVTFTLKQTEGALYYVRAMMRIMPYVLDKGFMLSIDCLRPLFIDPSDSELSDPNKEFVKLFRQHKTPKGKVEMQWSHLPEAVFNVVISKVIKKKTDLQKQKSIYDNTIQKIRRKKSMNETTEDDDNQEQNYLNKSEEQPLSLSRTIYK